MTGAAFPPELQLFTALAVFRGFGAPVEKSALLLSVSVHPFPARNAAVVLVRVGVGPAPSNASAPDPKPTKSLMAADVQLFDAPHVNAVVFVTRATFPDVAAIGMFPVASGVGKLEVPPEPAASCTK